MRLPAVLLLVLSAVLVVACAGATSASLAPGNGEGASEAPAPSSSAAPEPVTSEDEAIARIVAMEPRLAGIGPKDPDMIGSSSWYSVVEEDAGYRVEVYLGWGDCMAGCIDDHTWVYEVGRDGRVELVTESGTPVPDDEWPSPGGTGRTGILGTAVAGPTCPVEQPGDPSCDPRPVPGAVVRIFDSQQAELGQAVSDASGRFFVELPAGSYTVVPQPVDGLLGTPDAVSVEVRGGESTLELSYDTGIR